MISFDQVVSFGELISTTILSNFMNFMNIKTQWVDVRNFIKTNSNYRDAEVNWDLTQKNISKHKRKF
jgi:aspartate kinase